MGIFKNSEYYDISDVLKTHAQYYLLLSGRDRGKSYQVAEKFIRDFIESETMFIYLRRYKDDIKTANIEEWFVNLGREKINQLTNGKYDVVVCYNQRVWLSKIDENDNIVRGVAFGRWGGLNRASKLKSTIQDKRYGNIVYEEFIATDEPYLEDEPNKLMDFVSTVFRSRLGNVFLVGNLISKICPYYSEWGLSRVLTQEYDTIDLYEIEEFYNGIKKTTLIAVEMIRPKSELSQMFFGQKAKQIRGITTTGKLYPRLTGRFKQWEQIATIFLWYDGVHLALDLLCNDFGERVIAVRWDYKPKHTMDIVISNDHKEESNFYANMNTDRPLFLIFRKLIHQNKIFFKTDEIGQLFEDITKSYNWF